MEIRYFSYDGDPALTYVPGDGSMLAWVKPEGRDWQEAHAADLATKAHVITKADFESMWPDTSLPPVS